MSSPVFRTRLHVPVFALTLAAAPACGLLGLGEPELNDGEVCSVDEDCSTEVCTSANLCSHSRCECPSGECAAGGEPSSECREGWVCVGYDSIFDPIKEFFGGTPNPSDGYCQPSCEGGCPEHYLCTDELCSPDVSWTSPQPTIAWTGPVEGELSGHDRSTTVLVEEDSKLTLTGSATSPTGAAIIDMSWTTVSGAGDYMDFEGDMIETTVPAGSYRRVELDVVDDQHRSGHVNVIFEACRGAGTTCGYEGSGCCEGCDDATDTCL